MNLPWVNRFFLGKSLWCDHSLYLAGKLQIIKSAPYMTHQRNSIQAYHLLIKSRSAVFYPFSKLWTQTHDFPIWCNCGFKHCRKGRSTKEIKKTIIPQCLCKIFNSESVLKQSRYKRFKRCCTIKILPYKFINGQVFPAAFSLSVRPSEGAR